MRKQPVDIKQLFRYELEKNVKNAQSSCLKLDRNKTMSKEKSLNVIAGSSDKPVVIGDIKIGAFVLEDETRVLSQRSMVAGLGLRSGGGSSGTATKVPRFLTSKILKPFISDTLLVKLRNPILFTTSKGQVFGYSANIFLEVIDVVLAAKNANKLLQSQQHIAIRCEALKKALPAIGIIALIDESTGYQKIRDFDNLRKSFKDLLEKYISEFARPWDKEFKDDFFIGVDKIYQHEKTTSKNRPKFYGKFINKYIYKPLERGLILQKLVILNPTDSKGNRKKRFHQFFVKEPGLRILRTRIDKITALLEISENKEDFEFHYKKFQFGQKRFPFK